MGWLKPHPIPAITTDVAKLAYLAGIIDGEGTVTIARWKPPVAKLFPYDFYQRVIVSNTSEELLVWIQQNFTIGKASYQRRPPPRTGTKPVYRISFDSRHVKHLLRAILPYLIIKRRNAELLLAFPRPSDTWVGRGADGRQLTKYQSRVRGVVGHRTPEMYAEQERIWREIRELNKAKGPAAGRRSA